MRILFRSLLLLLFLPLLVVSQQKITWNKDGAKMVLIPAGSFEMGDAMNEPENWMDRSRPVHTVELDAFYIDIYEVTVGQFKRFVNQSGYSYKRWNEVARYSPADDYPMVYIDWNDATAYAKWAGKRLPTEGEWEYAARGGLEGKRYPWGGEPPTIERANYNKSVGRLTIVGSYPANGYGLYDMAGNAWEWCQDWYGEDYYSSSPVNAPQGPETGSRRVLRSGSWPDNPFLLRVAVRYFNYPTNRTNYVGFRCVSGSNVTITDQRQPPTAKLTGDINGDGAVNIFDLVIAAGSFGKTGTDIMGDVNGDGEVNIFDLVVVAGNFGKSLVAAPSMTTKIELTTEQKHYIASAIDQLESNSNRSNEEEIVLNVLIAILPERLPTQTQLLANYPNPFNPETWIPFKLAQDSTVTARIYDVTGKQIRIIELGHIAAGNYVEANRAIYWDGKTEDGEQVSSGTYFYQIEAGDYTETRKMVILK